MSDCAALHEVQSTDYVLHESYDGRWPDRGELRTWILENAKKLAQTFGASCLYLPQIGRAGELSPTTDPRIRGAFSAAGNEDDGRQGRGRWGLPDGHGRSEDRSEGRSQPYHATGRRASVNDCAAVISEACKSTQTTSVKGTYPSIV